MMSLKNQEDIMSTKNYSSEERIKYWQTHIANWKRSHQNQADYCRKNSLNTDLFSRWKNRLSKDEIESPLVELKLDTISSPYLDLIIHDKIKIRLKDNFNPDLLKNILILLGIEL